MEEINLDNLEYLRPSDKIMKKFYLSPQDIKFGETTDKIYRKIFEHVQYDNCEVEALNKLKEMATKQGIQGLDQLPEHLLYKFLHSNRFNFSNALKGVQGYLAKTTEIPEKLIDERCKRYITEGIMYIAGRDRQLQPILIIVLTKLSNDQNETEPFMNALLFLMNMALTKMTIPGKVEKMVLMLDAAEAKLSSFPMAKIIKLMEKTKQVFPACLDRIIIINPSIALKGMMNLLTPLLSDNFKQRIHLLSQEKDIKQIVEKIPLKQLEQRYGGLAQTITNYWPPVDSLYYWDDQDTLQSPDGDKTDVELSDTQSGTKKQSDLKTELDQLANNKKANKDPNVDNKGAMCGFCNSGNNKDKAYAQNQWKSGPLNNYSKFVKTVSIVSMIFLICNVITSMAV